MYLADAAVFDPSMIPPGNVLRTMTQTQLVQLQHDLAQIEAEAKAQGFTAVAAEARAARDAVFKIYTAWGIKDVSALDRAIMQLDRLNQAVAGAARDIVIGAAGAAGAAAGAAVKPIASAVLPLTPILLGLAALWLFATPAGRRLTR